MRLPNASHSSASYEIGLHTYRIRILFATHIVLLIMLDDTDTDEEWPTEPPQDPPPPPRVFPRTKWKTAPLKYQDYPKHRTSAFEIAVAAKKASIAWAKARDSGDWSGAEDKRWFILAVTDRAHQR